MSAQGTTTRGRGSTDESDSHVLARARKWLRDGTGAVFAGAALIVGATRSSGGRSKLQVLAGVALVALGVHQRRSKVADGSSIETLDQEVHIESDDDDEVSDEARANLERHRVGGAEGENPRDVSESPDVETEEDEGDIQFTRDQDEDVREEPGLDDADSTDPRKDAAIDDDDADVEVDISEAAMAEEPSEAVGPSDTQSQPTTTKDASTTAADDAGDDVTDSDDDKNQDPPDSDEQTSFRLDDADDDDDEGGQ